MQEMYCAFSQNVLYSVDYSLLSPESKAEIVSLSFDVMQNSNVSFGIQTSQRHCSMSFAKRFSFSYANKSNFREFAHRE